MMWQLADEPHGIGEPEAIPSADVHFAREGIEGGEETVLHEHLRTRERPQQTRLTGIGVADEAGTGKVATALALVRAVIGDLLQPSLQRRDLAPDDPPVGLELGLARPPEPDTPPDATQGGPHAAEAGQRILQRRPRRLHLRPRGAAAG